MHIQLLYKLLPSFLCDSYKRWNNYQKNSILQQTIKCKESNSKWRVIDIKTLNNFLNEWWCVHRIMLLRFTQRMFYSSVKNKNDIKIQSRSYYLTWHSNANLVTSNVTPMLLLCMCIYLVLLDNSTFRVFTLTSY